jgi:hypothetical protein
MRANPRSRLLAWWPEAPRNDLLRGRFSCGCGWPAVRRKPTPIAAARAAARWTPASAGKACMSAAVANSGCTRARSPGDFTQGAPLAATSSPAKANIKLGLRSRQRRRRSVSSLPRLRSHPAARLADYCSRRLVLIRVRQSVTPTVHRYRGSRRAYIRPASKRMMTISSRRPKPPLG